MTRLINRTLQSGTREHLRRDETLGYRFVCHPRVIYSSVLVPDIHVYLPPIPKCQWPGPKLKPGEVDTQHTVFVL